jgi:HD-GYP domain-containing protein (c-di-GMP phosphodiesterase class II)
MTQTTAAALGRSVVDGGYASLVLDRLARQARAVLDVERTSIFVRDRADARRTIAAATCGAGEDMVGSRFLIAGLTERVLSGGKPAVREQRSRGRLPGQGLGEVIDAHAAVPIGWSGQVQGALLADMAQRGRHFTERDIELLGELAWAVGRALSHAERRRELLPTVQARVAALVSMIDARDGYTARHSAAVVDLVRRLGSRLGLGPAELFELELSALLHDIGKIGVPDSILQKPEALSAEEWDVMRRHPTWGAELLPSVPGLEPVGMVVRYHHERWDGDGYPSRLERDRIPVASRIIAICDAYQAMTSDRPYRSALSHEDAISRLREGAGSQFDPAIVEPLVDLLAEEGLAVRAGNGRP